MTTKEAQNVFMKCLSGQNDCKKKAQNVPINLLRRHFGLLGPKFYPDPDEAFKPIFLSPRTVKPHLKPFYGGVSFSELTLKNLL